MLLNWYRRRFTSKQTKQVENPVLHYNSIHANDPRFSSYRSSATKCHLANGKYDTAKLLLRSNHPPMGIDSTYPGNDVINGDRRMENPKWRHPCHERGGCQVLCSRSDCGCWGKCCSPSVLNTATRMLSFNMYTMTFNIVKAWLMRGSSDWLIQ